MAKCTWCNKREGVEQIDNDLLCNKCMGDYHKSMAAEQAAEQAAENLAHLAFHFPGSYGPHAGLDPDDQRERELEALYWDEAERNQKG